MTRASERAVEAASPVARCRSAMRANLGAGPGGVHPPDYRGYVFMTYAFARRAQRVTVPEGGGDWPLYCARYWLPTYACSISFHWTRHQFGLVTTCERRVLDVAGENWTCMYNVRAEESILSIAQGGFVLSHILTYADFLFN